MLTFREYKYVHMSQSMLAAIIKYYSLSSLQTAKICYPHFWRMGWSTVKGPTDSVSGSSTSWSVITIPFHSHKAEEERDLSVASVLRALISFVRAPPPCLVTSPEFHL